MFARVTMAIAIGLLMAAAVPAAAQRADDAEAFAAARELLRATNFNSQVRATAEQVTDRTITTIMEQFRSQQGRAFPPALETELRQILREHNDALLTAIEPTALDDAARIYARYFSAEEIRELQRMQTSPVMIKFQRVMPQFFAELTQISAGEAMRRMPELRRRVDEAIERWIAQEARNGNPPAS
ncbi:MAG: hypothetical protein QOH03_5480 [Kribbellaceae bacterium]|jgi:hypothetical protein|nr:hypothetical protein [Kribbellaceae bacterium]